MKVKDQNYQNEIKRLDAARERLVTTKERDIKNIEKVYDSKIDQTRSNAEEKLVEVKNQGERRVLEELKNNESKLENYKQDLNKTSEQLEKQKQALTFNYMNQMDSMRDAYTENINEKYNLLSDQSKNINIRTNDRVKKIISDSNLAVENAGRDTRVKLDSKVREGEVKLQQETQKQQLALKAEELQHYQNTANAKLTHERELSQQMMKNTTELSSKEIAHKKELKVKEDFYSKRLKDKHESFKQKYTTLSEDHQKVLARIQDQFSKEIESMVEGHAQKKRALASKQTDTFYTVGVLEPEIKASPKEYVISLEIPEHEKDGVRLAGNDRLIRLNITRNFNDEFEGPDGSRNRSSRSEVYSREFKVDEIVDAKNITQTYSDGKIHFRVPKK